MHRQLEQLHTRCLPLRRSFVTFEVIQLASSPFSTITTTPLLITSVTAWDHRPSLCVLDPTPPTIYTFSHPQTHLVRHFISTLLGIFFPWT